MVATSQMKATVAWHLVQRLGVIDFDAQSCHRGNRRDTDSNIVGGCRALISNSPIGLSQINSPARIYKAVIGTDPNSR